MNDQAIGYSRGPHKPNITANDFAPSIAFDLKRATMPRLMTLRALSLILLTPLLGTWSEVSLFAETKSEWDGWRAISHIKGVATAEDAQEIGDLQTEQAEAAPGSEGRIAAQIKAKQAEVQKLNADAKSLICPGS
jgi:hypothetical protein